jgi:YD repeat-containing protein
LVLTILASLTFIASGLLAAGQPAIYARGEGAGEPTVIIAEEEPTATLVPSGAGTAPPLPSETATWGAFNDGKRPTPTEAVNMTPMPEARFTGWERQALRDLADINAWPTQVTYDTAGRLKAQNAQGDSAWSARAHIRAFDFGAGASAAFNAEQEDARLSGFALTNQVFYGYRAYRGVITDRTGAVREQRFRWLARTWIFGIDIRASAGSGQPLPDPVLLSEQLLSLAVRRGLPPPPNPAPTPNPTWSLPPDSTPTPPSCNIRFNDVPQDYWAYGFISSLACSNIVSGYADGSFRPENSTTRAQLAKMLVLTQRWPVDTNRTQSFRDVPPTHPFFLYIETAAAHGVISGYGDGTFHPDAYITRAQVAKMVVLARGWRAFEDTPVPLCDVPNDHWAWHYIQAAIQNGLFSGYANNCFLPDAKATRAQLSKVLILSTR